jgi:hypothetical protein
MRERERERERERYAILLGGEIVSLKIIERKIT